MAHSPPRLLNLLQIQRDDKCYALALHAPLASRIFVTYTVSLNSILNTLNTPSLVDEVLTYCTLDDHKPGYIFMRQIFKSSNGLETFYETRNAE